MTHDRAHRGWGRLAQRAAVVAAALGLPIALLSLHGAAAARATVTTLTD